MFDLHLGASLRVPSVKFLDGFFLTGNPGQGKSICLEQIVLEAIKNRQSGLFIDPYGDIAENIQGHLKTPEAKKHVLFTNLDLDQKHLNTFIKDKFVVASGHFLDEGNRRTFEKGSKLLVRFFKQAKSGQWLVVDESLSFVTDELFENFMGAREYGLHTVFAASDFFLLSKEERHRFAKQIKHLIIYKPRHMNAVLMAQERKELNPEDIKAIKQYHFQLLLDGKVSYHAGVFPIESI